MSDVGLGELIGLLAAMAWAGSGLLVRAHGAGFNGLTINAMRSTLAGLFFAIAWPFASSHQPVPLEAWLYLIGSLVIGIAVGDSMYFEALKRIGVARAMPISMGYPVLTFALAVTVLHEPAGPRALLGMVLTLGGVYLVAIPTAQARLEAAQQKGGGHWQGVALAALAAVAWSISTILLRPALLLTDVPTASMIRMTLVAALLWAVAARAGVLPDRSHLKGRTLVAMALTGMTTVAATGFFLASISLAGAGRAAVLTATSPLFGVPFSILFMGERGSWRLAAGTLCSVFGVILLAEV